VTSTSAEHRPMKAFTYIVLVCGALILVRGTIMAQTALTAHAVAAGSRTTSAVHTDPKALWALPTPDKVNEGTVTILSAPVGGVTAILASDLARVLDNDELRVLQVVGKGPVQNVIDILDLKSIDMGVVVSDVPEFFKLQYNIADIAVKLRSIAKLYNNEIHLIAPTSIKTVFDLAGKKIMAPKNVGFYSAKIIFSRLNIDAIFDVDTDDNLGLQKVAEGEADAWIVSTGKVMPIARNLPNDSGRLHLVSIPYDPRLQDIYLPASLTSEDYPNLIRPGETVATLATTVLLATYNWPQSSDRYVRVAKFVDAFFSKIDQLGLPPRHPKWREASISATIPGWQRFKAATDWLDARSHAERNPGESRYAAIVTRGRQLLKNGDFASARLLLQEAADAGDAAAALALGETYDPVVLNKLGIHGRVADITIARMWYKRAGELGSAEAPVRLRLLVNQPL
jgi:TRAP-type uncharacterized transport system substrate-binding protein